MGEDMSSKYVRKLSVWITQEQDDKIAASGQDDSEFVREAIDEKDYQFHELKSRMEGALIDDLINYLSDKKEGECQTSCQTKPQEMGENVRQLYSEMENVRQNCHTNDGELSDNSEKSLEGILGNSLQTVVNILHASGRLNQKQKDVISNNVGLSNRELMEVIDEYHDELMAMIPGH